MRSRTDIPRAASPQAEPKVGPAAGTVAARPARTSASPNTVRFVESTNDGNKVKDHPVSPASDSTCSSASCRDHHRREKPHDRATRPVPHRAATPQYCDDHVRPTPLNPTAGPLLPLGLPHLHPHLPMAPSFLPPQLFAPGALPHFPGTRPHFATPAPVLHDLGFGPTPLFGWGSVVPLAHGYGQPRYFRRVKPDYRRFCFSVGKAEVPYAALPGGPLWGSRTTMSPQLMGKW